MAKTRGINTKFWSDVWVRESLNPLDRYLFLYLLTNEHTNISGVYELSLGTLAFESGIDKEDLQKTMLKRLAPKVFYFRGFVIIPNFPKHQNLQSPDVVKGVQRELQLAPEDVQKEAVRRGWGDGLGIAQGTKPNLTKLTDSKIGILPFTIQKVIENEKPTREKKDTTYLKVFELWGKYPLNWKKNTTQIAAAKNLLAEQEFEDIDSALKYYFKHKGDDWIPEILTPSDLDRKWLKLEAFYDKKHG